MIYVFSQVEKEMRDRLGEKRREVVFGQMSTLKRSF